jgi:hypothetical protein
MAPSIIRHLFGIFAIAALTVSTYASPTLPNDATLTHVVTLTDAVEIAAPFGEPLQITFVSVYDVHFAVLPERLVMPRQPKPVASPIYGRVINKPLGNYCIRQTCRSNC